MYVTKNINAEHEDLIHDVAYDFYGKRMATCSSDQKVKVWDQDEAGNWVCSASWKTHNGSVWKVNFAHPEFGQVSINTTDVVGADTDHHGLFIIDHHRSSLITDHH